MGPKGPPSGGFCVSWRTAYQLPYTRKGTPCTKTTPKSGFTIVELLIVIVVIGILAAISAVAYTGITQSAQNAQTKQAAAQWVKAMQLYKTEKGYWPIPRNICLGEGYNYGISGTDTSGIAQCRQDSLTVGLLTENSSFDVAMAPYIGAKPPTPAMITVTYSSGAWKRGLSYFQAAEGVLRIDAVYTGNVSPCPTIGGTSIEGRAVGSNSNTECRYVVGNTSDS